MFKVNYKSRSGAFIVNIEHISLISSVFMVAFEQVSVFWVLFLLLNLNAHL